MMNAVTTTTFAVSDVKRATESLPEVCYKEAVEALLPRHTPRRPRLEVHRSVPFPKLSSRPVESCSRYHSGCWDVAFHPVVAAIHRAFMNHHPLCSRPIRSG